MCLSRNLASSIKYLGVTVDKKLSSTEHVNLFTRLVKLGVPPEEFKALFPEEFKALFYRCFILINPILDYVSAVWLPYL